MVWSLMTPKLTWAEAHRWLDRQLVHRTPSHTDLWWKRDGSHWCANPQLSQGRSLPHDVQRLQLRRSLPRTDLLLSCVGLPAHCPSAQAENIRLPLRPSALAEQLPLALCSPVRVEQVGMEVAQLPPYGEQERVKAPAGHQPHPPTEWLKVRR